MVLLVDALAQLSAALSDRYAVEREIGSGGMATVYVARDLRHDRKVALKVLNPELGAVIGVERFLGEIRVTANLQHPNLLPLFDSGQADGILFYVMPFVDGESLRHRLEREKQLPVDDAVRIAVAIADALDYAHAHGVIHRDLKPENILLQHGQPVIADFGIALAISNAGGARITQTGLSLGTPQYMSPEQATGDRSIDGRTDIYSLGAVLYEMLAGEPPHAGAAQAIIAKLMTEDARPITVLRKSVPPHVDGAIRCALERLPADRFSTAREFADALSGARPVHAVTTGAASSVSITPRQRILRTIPWAAAAVATTAALWQLAHPRAETSVLAEFTIPVPDTLRFGGGAGTRITVSPDGSMLVYALQTPNGHQMLYMRRLVDTVPQPIPGTDDGISPQFTADGRSIYFLRGVSGRDRSPVMVPVGGGTARPITPAFSGAISVDEHGRFLNDVGGALFYGNSESGTSHELIKSDSTQTVRGLAWPSFLPGGAYAVVSYWRRGALSLDSARLGLVSIEDGHVEDLRLLGLNAHYVEPGYLVYGRLPGDLFAAPFSLSKRRITGPAVRLVSDVQIGGGGAVSFGVSRNGTLAFIAAVDLSRKLTMFSVDRRGTEQAISRVDTAYVSPRVSPDGHHILVTIGSLRTNNRAGTQWIYDVASGSSTRVAADTDALRGEWSPDGSRVLYERTVGDSAFVFSRPWDLSAPAMVVARGPDQMFNELSFGRAHGLAAMRARNVRTAILIAPMDSLEKARPLFDRVATMVNPRVSPSGTLLAFSSDEKVPSEVYVTPIPGPGPRVAVSVGGGTEPMWSRDGKTLYYRGGTSANLRMLAATIAERPSPVVVRQDTLFADVYDRRSSHAQYDVFPDGRFLMTRPSSRTPAQRASPVVIMNWQRLLEGAAPNAR